MQIRDSKTDPETQNAATEKMPRSSFVWPDGSEAVADSRRDDREVALPECGLTTLIGFDVVAQEPNGGRARPPGSV